MMRNPDGGVALAVRKPDGTIATEYTVQKSRARKGTFLGLPVVRGVVAFVESLVNGMQMTTHAADIYAGGTGEQEEPTKFEKWLASKLGKDAGDIAMGIAVVLAIILALGLFVFLPSFLLQLIPWGDSVPNIVRSLVEGVVRLLIFLGYVAGISCIKDVKRLYQYHGAEHKVISCYEHEAELTPESAIKYSRFHARCGTNYLFLVMAISILFFACLPYSSNFFLRVLTRLVFIPLVAGISYEVLKACAASDSLIARIVRAPGLALQRLTTREPELDMLEVALAAFHLAMNNGKMPEPPMEETQPSMEEGSATDFTHPSMEAETECGGKMPDATIQEE